MSKTITQTKNIQQLKPRPSAMDSNDTNTEEYIKETVSNLALRFQQEKKARKLAQGKDKIWAKIHNEDLEREKNLKNQLEFAQNRIQMLENDNGNKITKEDISSMFSTYFKEKDEKEDMEIQKELDEFEKSIRRN